MVVVIWLYISDKLAHLKLINFVVHKLMEILKFEKTDFTEDYNFVFWFYCLEFRECLDGFNHLKIHPILSHASSCSQMYRKIMPILYSQVDLFLYFY